jgi:hypothetical protein
LIPGIGISGRLLPMQVLQAGERVNVAEAEWPGRNYPGKPNMRIGIYMILQAAAWPGRGI